MSDTSVPQTPVLRFSEPVRADLESSRPGLADETEQMMSTHIRPCVAITSRRVSSLPLRRNPLVRFFGGSTAEPKLDITESKFGGTPYSERGESWKGYSFLGQIDLARATSVLPPNAPKLSGLLRIDLGDSLLDIRVRWFRDINLDQACCLKIPSVGSWETKLDFKIGWTIPEGDALEAIWPIPEPQWYEYEQFFPTGFNSDGNNEFHRLLGHKSSGLDEAHMFASPSDDTNNIADYECLLRLTLDVEAGFDWGTNWIYLLVNRKDLLRGDLSQVVSAVANS